MTILRVNVHHITRVEGHGNIVVDVRNGELKQCDLEIVETPRFFEAMLAGRPYVKPRTSPRASAASAPSATPRLRLRATEKALGVELSEQTVLLRKLTFHGEMLDSHILHAYMLVAPDLLGVASVVPLAKTAPGRRPARPAHEEAGRRPVRRPRRPPHPPHRHDRRRLHPLPHRRPRCKSCATGWWRCRPDVDATVELFQKLQAAGLRARDRVHRPAQGRRVLLHRRHDRQHRRRRRGPSRSTARSPTSSSCPTPRPSAPSNQRRVVHGRRAGPLQRQLRPAAPARPRQPPQPWA